jgi:hypothetical protein
MRAAREDLRDEEVVSMMGWLGCFGKRFGKRFGKLSRIVRSNGMVLLVFVKLR